MRIIAAVLAGLVVLTGCSSSDRPDTQPIIGTCVEDAVGAGNHDRLVVDGRELSVRDGRLFRTDDDGSEHVLADRVDRLLAVAPSSGGPVALFASVADVEGHSDLIIIGVDGVNPIIVGTAAAEEYYVLGASYDGAGNWVLTAISDLTTLVISQPIEGEAPDERSRVLQPYDYNTGPVIEAAVSLDDHSGFLLLERTRDTDAQEDAAYSWQMTVIDKDGSIVRTAPWPAGLAVPDISGPGASWLVLDGPLVDDEPSSTGFVRTTDGRAGISLTGDSYRVRAVCP